ncbi:DNA-binding protein, partial [Acinetobacter baumannii]
KQLEQAHEREKFQRDELKAKNDQLHVKDEQIEAMQRLLAAPNTNMIPMADQKPSQDIATFPRPEPEPKHDGLTTLAQTENKRI